MFLLKMWYNIYIMKNQNNISKIHKRTISPPDFFKPIMWSYDFPKIDLNKDKKRIIVNAINYGDLRHWKWIMEHYGRKTIQKVLADVPISEIRPRVLKLASVIFSVKDFNYVLRGVK